MTADEKFISIRAAAEHNLKGIDVDIPRDQMVVITGISGSGKSSLAFDTIYAEGQRKYVESLSAYARQFLEQMRKPAFESIEGLLDEVPNCDPRDITCVRAAYSVEINNLIQCMTSDEMVAFLFVNCSIGAFLEGIQSGWQCHRGDQLCVATTVVEVILDLVSCVNVAIGSGPGEVTSTSN